VLLFGLMPAYALLNVERNRTRAAQEHLNAVRADLEQAQVDQGALEEINAQIQETRQQLDLINAELEAVGQGGRSRSAGINAIIISVAETVRITSIQQESRAFSISGEAVDQDAVVDYARALQDGGWFKNVRVLSINNPNLQTPDVLFTIQVEQ